VAPDHGTDALGRWCGRLVASLVALLATVAPATPAIAGSLATLTNPRTNVSPAPDFLSAGRCVTTTTHGATHGATCSNPCVGSRMAYPRANDSAPACTTYVWRALSRASVVDGAGPLILPSNWTSLTVAEQLFVLADLERVDRGYPPFLGLNAALDHAASRAAHAGGDPTGTGSFRAAAWGGAWSAGFSPLVADYLWMYDDGWGGSARATPNLACSGPHAPDCWSHRDALLGVGPAYHDGVGPACTDCEMGAAYVPRTANGSGASYVDLVARPSGRAPAMVFTWRQELPYLAATSSTTATTTARTLPQRDAARPVTG
jgi:hypothetical protein